MVACGGDPANIEKSWLNIDLTDGPDSVKTPTRNVTTEAGHPKVVYSTDFPMPWGSKVSAYFLTKAIAAGIAIAALVAIIFGASLESAWMSVGAPLAGGVFLAITGVVLIADLKRPDRFYYLLTKGNPSSWLVRGAWILSAQAVTFGVWFLAGVTNQDSIARGAIWAAAIVGLGTAGYTAFLFGQARGRTLWNSPALVWHMIAAAFAVGGGVSLVVSIVSTVERSTESIGSLAAAHGPVGTTAFAFTMLVGAIGLAMTALFEARNAREPDAAAAYRHLTKGTRNAIPGRSGPRNSGHSSVGDRSAHERNTRSRGCRRSRRSRGHRARRRRVCKSWAKCSTDMRHP